MQGLGFRVLRLPALKFETESSRSLGALSRLSWLIILRQEGCKLLLRTAYVWRPYMEGRGTWQIPLGD